MAIGVSAQINYCRTIGGRRQFSQAVHTRFLAVMSSVLQTTSTTVGIICGSLPQKDNVTGGGPGVAA